MDAPRDITPLFASYGVVYSFVTESNDGINADVKWGYCSVLISMFEGGSYGVVVKQSQCFSCDFSGRFIAAGLIGRDIEVISHQGNRIVNMKLPGMAQRIQLRFCLEEDFWWFINEVSGAMLASPQSKDEDQLVERMNQRSSTMQGLDQHLEIFAKIRTTAGRLQGNWIVSARTFISPETNVRDIDRCFADLAESLEQKSHIYRNCTLVELKDIANRMRTGSFWGDTSRKLASAVSAINASRAACNQLSRRFQQCERFLPEEMRLSLGDSIERCRQDCAAGRTQERRLRFAFRGLKYILDALVLREDELEQVFLTFSDYAHIRLYQETINVLRHRIHQIHHENEDAMNAAIVAVVEAVINSRAAPHKSVTLQEAGMSLTTIQRDTEARMLDQDECLVSVRHLIELASCQPDILSTESGCQIIIADLRQAIRDFDSLHIELAAVTLMVHDTKKTAAKLTGFIQDATKA